MSKIIYTRANGEVSIVVPTKSWEDRMDEVMAKDVNDAIDTPEIVEDSEIPNDRTFRNAWGRNIGGNKLGVHMDKAKEITHGKRRAARAIEMAPFDEIVAKQIPGQNAGQAEAARAQLRNKYDNIQTDIDACENPEDLKTIIDYDL